MADSNPDISISQSHQHKKTIKLNKLCACDGCLKLRATNPMNEIVHMLDELVDNVYKTQTNIKTLISKVYDLQQTYHNTIQTHNHEQYVYNTENISEDDYSDEGLQTPVDYASEISSNSEPEIYEFHHNLTDTELSSSDIEIIDQGTISSQKHNSRPKSPITVNVNNTIKDTHIPSLNDTSFVPLKRRILTNSTGNINRPTQSILSPKSPNEDIIRRLRVSQRFDIVKQKRCE